MGMAAGQARLLSITSRMSDNELRAQIINNNKMRLATQSSQVSEAYVTALNEAQMMFTNYDADNNTSYQPLTFNALTAYNPYNNQYILTNASGNVLLSEKDATNYVNANGDVTKFLSFYGLENTTTYFENLAAHAEGNGIKFKTGVFDEKGAEEIGVIYAPNENATPEAVAKYIQDLYEGNLNDTYTDGKGNTTKLHPGYMNAVSSEDYYNYNRLLNDYNVKYDTYLETIAQLMSEKIVTMTGDGKTLEQIKTDVENATATTSMVNVFSALEKFITNAKEYAINDAGAEGTGNKSLNNLMSLINDNKGDYQTSYYSADNGYTIESGSNTLTITDSSNQKVLELTKDTSGTSGSGKIYSYDEEGGETSKDISYISDTKWSYTTETTNEDGTTSSVTTNLVLSDNYFTSAPDDDWKIEQQLPNDLENMKSIANMVISSLKSAIYTVWDPGKFKPTNGDYGWAEYDAYKKAAQDLSMEIFGIDVGEANYANLGDIDWTKGVLDTGDIQEGENTKHYNITDDKKNAFQKIYDAYLLDCIMNTYGEPKYTWINTNNPDENGEAKAQWYENLFERIQQGGYKVLQDGLASSNEWIQFAFESGIVTMEQVDSNKNWQPLIYSNCSDITEQTNDAAIAKAEAEYKSAMNKIENKDKRYDLELKNIDTEHNSLQVEYDSIKTAIDKNIERTFKLYS